MKFDKYKDSKSIKAELSEGEIETVIDLLKYISLVLTNSLSDKIEGLHFNWSQVEDNNIRGTITDEQVRVGRTLIVKNASEIIDQIFDSFAPDEFENAIQFAANFEKGEHFYKKKEWEESLAAYKEATTYYIPKFEKALFDLETKMLVVDAQIALSKHKVFFGKTDEALNATSQLSIDTFLQAPVFKNHSIKNQILLYKDSLKFTPIIKGTYKPAQINRVYTEIQVPRSENVSKIVKNGITAEQLEQEILVVATNKIDKALNYTELEEIAPLSIRNNKNTSYQITETELLECDSCGSDGSLRCTDCRQGFQECEGCQGDRFVNCKECDGMKNVVCTSCHGIETKTCPDCRDNKDDCHRCNGNGEIEADCKLCDNKREIDCTKCAVDGKIKCDKCKGYGTENCETCEGSGTLKCETCQGTKYLYRISFVKTENTNCEEPFLYELDRSNNSIQELKTGVAHRLKNAEGYKSSDVEVLSFFRTDGHKVDFEVEAQQETIRKEQRNLQGINQESKYPLLTQERIKYEILPCFKVGYSSVYNKKEQHNLYMPIQDNGQFDLVFEKTPNIEKLRAKSKFKIGLGRAFSTEKQLAVDDIYKEVNLLVHLANQDNELDFLEKSQLAELLADRIPHFSKEEQTSLFDRVKNEQIIPLNPTIYRFSRKENGLQALHNINQVVSKEKVPEKIEKELTTIRAKIEDSSPQSITYISNFFGEPTIFLPILLLFFLSIALIVYYLVNS